MTKKCKVTVERISRETYEMELEGDCVQVLDQARAMVAKRNLITQADTTFHVAKVETIKE